MKIVVVSYDMMTGCSGAWTSVCDLLERDHELYFVCGRFNGEAMVEGHKVIGFNYNENILKNILKTFTPNIFDFFLCLGDREVKACHEVNILPFMMRFHTLPFNMKLAEAMKQYSFWCIENHPLEQMKHLVDDVIPHVIDPERYTKTYEMNLKKPWDDIPVALLLSTLNWVESPLTFIQAVKASNIEGIVYGDGVIKQDVILACSNSRGKVSYFGSVNRLSVPSALSFGQIGVACLSPQSKNNRQLKVLEYCAAGLYPIVSQYTMMEDDFKWINYTDRASLVRIFNMFRNKENRDLTEDIKHNRKLVEENWNAKYWAKIFNEKLESKLNGKT